MLHMQDIIYTHMSDTLYGTLDQHLKQPVLAWQSLQKPLTDHRRLSVLCQQKVCPVLYQKFLLGMDKSFQQEWRPCGSNQLTSYTSNWLIGHLKGESSEVVKKISKSYQKLSKNVLGGNGKVRSTVTLHLSQKLSATWQRKVCLLPPHPYPYQWSPHRPKAYLPSWTLESTTSLDSGTDGGILLHISHMKLKYVVSNTCLSCKNWMLSCHIQSANSWLNSMFGVCANRSFSFGSHRS